MKAIRFFTAVICLFALVGCKHTDVNVYGYWSIEEAMNQKIENNDIPAYINFRMDSICNGFASVNYFDGEFTMDGDRLTISNVVMTKMMGPNMDQEADVFEALNSAASVKMDGEMLYLLDGQGNVVMKLASANDLIAEVAE